MTELVRHEAPSLPEKMEWVRTMATANLLPRHYQNNPGNLFFAVEYADALGVDRMAAITSIHVIDGKPSASADLIASLVRRAGHKLRVEGDDTYAEATIIRADDPDYVPKPIRWDAAKARTAGKWGTKGPWTNYPGAMLRSRAITEAARMWASDVLFGVIYTPEELGAEVAGDGTVVHQVTRVEQQPTSSGADRMRQIVGTTQTGDAEGSQAETPVAGGEAGSSPAGHPSASSDPAGITPAQVKKLATVMGFLGLSDRDSALGYVANVIGRTVASRNDLTKAEANRVIDQLEADATAAGASGGTSADPAAGTPPADDVVDGEVIEDADTDALWAQIVEAGAALDMTTADLQDDFPAAMDGISADTASATELQAYLLKLQKAAA